MVHFLKTLVLGQPHARPTNEDLRPVIENQKKILKDIWENKYHNDFGLERLVRLSIAALLIYAPGTLVKACFEKHGILGRKLSIDVYALAKAILAIVILVCGWTGHQLIAALCLAQGLETVLYLSALIFLSNEFAQPISYRRSLIGIFINYVEVCLDYAVLYSYCSIKDPCFFDSGNTVTTMQAAYFSFVTSATVGYGDLAVTNLCGYWLVISQIILFLIFVALFINFFASKAQDATYHSARPRYRGRGKWQQPINNSKPDN